MEASSKRWGSSWVLILETSISWHSAERRRHMPRQRFSDWHADVFEVGRSLPADQISARYLNPRLRYYYFRFLKTNGRHVEILLLVSIFTFVSPSACHSAFAYQITSKSNHPRHTYNVISIFEDGGHGIAILLPVSLFSWLRSFG